MFERLLAPVLEILRELGSKPTLLHIELERPQFFWRRAILRVPQKPRKIPHPAQIHRLRLGLQPFDLHIFEKLLAQRRYILIGHKKLPLVRLRRPQSFIRFISSQNHRAPTYAHHTPKAPIPREQFRPRPLSSHLSRACEWPIFPHAYPSRKSQTCCELQQGEFPVSPLQTF